MNRVVYWALIVCFLHACRADQPSSLKSSSEPVYVRVPRSAIDQKFVLATGFERDHVQSERYAAGWLNQAVLDSLPADLRSTVVELDEQLMARTPFDLDALSEKDRDYPIRLDSYEDYHDYDALTTELFDLQAMFPDKTSLFSIGTSARGRELWVLKISDQAEDDENEPKLLYIANMHGDETVGRELLIYLARQLLTDYETDARIRRLVDHAQIYLMPSMNPDGFENARRGNGNGYDLNRNFPDFMTDPEDSPRGRQPETQAVMQLHADHHFQMAINFHGGEICFNMPWDTTSNRNEADRFGDDSLMRVLARSYADANASMAASGFDRGVTYGYEWYEVDGGMQDWASFYRRSIHATVELSDVKFPRAEYLASYWQENQESMLGYLESGMHGVHLRLVGTDGLEIQGATIRVHSAARRDVVYDTAYINRPTLPGEQFVTIMADGFVVKTLALQSSDFNGEFIDVVLESDAEI